MTLSETKEYYDCWEITKTEFYNLGAFSNNEIFRTTVDNTNTWHYFRKSNRP